MLYRSIYIKTSGFSSGGTIATLPSNAELIKLEGAVYRTNNLLVPINYPCLNTTYCINPYIDANKNLHLEWGSNITVSRTKAIAYYIKT